MNSEKNLTSAVLKVIQDKYVWTVGKNPTLLTVVNDYSLRIQ